MVSTMATAPTSQSGSAATSDHRTSPGTGDDRLDRTTLDTTCPSMAAEPSVAGHSSQARERSLAGRWFGRSSQATAAPARQSGIDTRSMTKRSGLSSTETPGGSSRVPPRPQ
jgi:hypothetical protein